MKLMSTPSFLPVEVQGAEGAPWRPLVLLEVASTAPAMEATSENFKALFDLVAADLASGHQKRERPEISEKPSKRSRPYAKTYTTKIVRANSSETDKDGEEDCLGG